MLTVPEWEVTYGGAGDPDGALIYPIIVALDSRGDVYVTDALDLQRPKHVRVRHYSPDFAFRASYDPETPGFGGTKDVSDIAFDSQDNMYLSDSRSDVVRVYDSGKRRIRELEGIKRPTAMAIGHDDALFVVSHPNKIHRYDSKASAFELLFEVDYQVCRPIQGKKGDPCQDAFVTDMVYTPAGKLMVVSQYDYVVLTYDLTGKLERMTPSTPMRDRWCQARNPYSHVPKARDLTICAGRLDYPFGIALDLHGRLYVTENSRFDAEGNYAGLDIVPKPRIDPYLVPSRVQIFDSRGGFVGMFGSYCRVKSVGVLPSTNTNCVGKGDAQFRQPHGIAVTSDGRRIYVADTSNHRLSVWRC